MKKQKPPASRRTPAKAVAREFKSYGIPGDLPRLLALGYIRRGRWTRNSIENDLANLEACINHNVVPGAGGRCLGRTDGVTKWEYWEVPDALAGHMEDLRKAATAVRRYLASEDLEAAAERMGGIEVLVQDICDQVNRPLVEHSRASTKKLSQGRRQRNAEAKSEARQRHAQWQRSANKIWRRNPTLSKEAVARHIKKADPSIGTKPGTIAKKIERPK